MLTRLLASAVFALSAGMAHADKLTVELNKFEEVEGGGCSAFFLFRNQSGLTLDVFVGRESFGTGVALAASADGLAPVAGPGVDDLVVVVVAVGATHECLQYRLTRGEGQSGARAG